MATRKKKPPGPVTLHALSDSTANLVRHMLTAFLTQFPPEAVRVRYATFVRTPEDLDRVFETIQKDPGPVEIRSRRQGAWNMPTTGYNERKHVEREVAWSRTVGAGVAMTARSTPSGTEPISGYTLMPNTVED